MFKETYHVNNNNNQSSIQLQQTEKKTFGLKNNPLGNLYTLS